MYELRVHSQQFAFHKLITGSVFFESSVQLFNNAIGNFFVFSAVEIVVRAAIDFDDSESKFDCI